MIDKVLSLEEIRALPSTDNKWGYWCWQSTPALPGVYFWFVNDELVYIGSSRVGLRSRLGHGHPIKQKIRRQCHDKLSTVYFLVVDAVDARRIESNHLVHYRPKWNGARTYKGVWGTGQPRINHG